MRSKRAENENGKKNQLTKENDRKKKNTEPPSGVNHFLIQNLTVLCTHSRPQASH